MRLLTFAVLIFSALSVSAQTDPCVELLLKQPGTWQQSKIPESTAPADLAFEKKNTTTIHEMIRSQFVPVGLDANWSAGFVKESNHPYDSWFYSLIALEFTCENGKIGKNHEGSSNLGVTFNQFGFGEIYDTTTDIQLIGYQTLRHGIPIEEKPGIWHFPIGRSALGYGRSGKSELWLFTFDGKLPWSYVTRKEFLIKRKRNLYGLMESSRVSTKETIANIEKIKSLKQEEYKNDPAKMDKYLSLDYKPVLDRYNKILEDNDKPYQAAISAIAMQLQQPASVLEQMAIVKQDTHNYLGYLFTEASDPMAQVPIQPNPGYFRKGPRHFIQMVEVELIWDHEDPITSKFHDDMLKALDLEKIKAFVATPAALH